MHLVGPLSPHPPPAPPQYFSPDPLVLLIPFLPQPQSPVSSGVPHLKLVQRKPRQMGVTPPTHIGQWAYSLGTGSSGSRWSPHGAHPGDGRMEELEELGEGRQVKNSHPRPADSPTHTNFYTHTPLSSICPSSNLYTQPFGGETCLTSHEGRYWKVCASYSAHPVLKFCCCGPCFCLDGLAHSQNSGRTRSLSPGGPAASGTHSGRAWRRPGILQVGLMWPH